MWVWQAGQDLVDTEKRLVLFDQPAVRAAILSFFSLYRYISKDMQHLAERDADQMFIDGKAAVTISGPWNIIYSMRTPEVAANMGLAIPLGCSYTGGASLIIWERTAQSAGGAGADRPPDQPGIPDHLPQNGRPAARTPGQPGELPAAGSLVLPGGVAGAQNRPFVAFHRPVGVDRRPPGARHPEGMG